MTDEVIAEGPPVLGAGLAGLAAGVGFWNAERAAAVDADLDADVASDFDRESRAEDAVWDALGGPGTGAATPASGQL